MCKYTKIRSDEKYFEIQLYMDKFVTKIRDVIVLTCFLEPS